MRHARLKLVIFAFGGFGINAMYLHYIIFGPCYCLSCECLYFHARFNLNLDIMFQAIYYHFVCPKYTVIIIYF